MITKVCGMREHDNIASLIELQPDYVGFIFYEASKRFVGGEFKMPEVPIGIKKVGVFVNEDLVKVESAVKKHSLDAVQLHGSESVEYCRKIRSSFPEITIIKAFAIREKADFEQVSAYNELCDLFIFDTKTEAYGGSGKKWNHSLLSNVELGKDFLLSGGIDKDFDYSKLESIHKRCVGIDLNSRFETMPGIKDINKLKIFLENE